MNRFFYGKLAANNIGKNAQTYIPYILSCIGTVMMYYIMYALSCNEDLLKISGGQLLMTILSLGTYVIGFFAVIFLFYTNSFLMKRRKKEFGLFNILGMEKKHIGRIILVETLYVSIISLCLGILGGILLSKLMYLLLLKILNFEVNLGVYISKPAIIATLILFGIIFILTLINALRQIHLAKPIELLKGGQVGEKEPKTKWILVAIGIVCLSVGYYISLTTESVIDLLTLFFLAVLLVIIGTYCLFTSISIAALKALRNNKKYYYQANHFTTVSGMIYRMKQNAVGLASICILATVVLVMVSTTVSMYIGMEDILRTRYPKDIIITTNDATEESIASVEEKVQNTLWNNQISGEDGVNYQLISFLGTQNGDQFSVNQNVSYSNSSLRNLNFMVLEDFNRNEKQSYTLEEEEILIYSNRDIYEYKTLEIFGKTYKVKEKLDSTLARGWDSAISIDSHYIIVKNKVVLEDIYKAQEEALGEMKSDYTHYMGFDVDMNEKEEIEFVGKLSSALEDNTNTWIESSAKSKESFYSLYGGIFFLGIFLSILFIMATVLIIYYKQVSEGYEDKNRFEIMQKVGMSRQEIKKSIKSQVLTVFFLPLITAAIHIAFAFKVITKLLALLNLTNVVLFAWCTFGTILVFAAFYALIYSVTARVYYNIVSN